MRRPRAPVFFVLSVIFAAASVFIHAEAPGRLVKRGRGSTGMCYEVTVLEKTAYVVNNQGLVILDIRNPDRPKKTGIVKDLWPSFCVDVSGGYAYVGGEGGLAVIDISDPENPRTIGAFLEADTINTVQIAGDLVYAVNAENTLEILSISNPESPLDIGSFNDGGHYYYHCLGIHDDVLYLADREQGLELIDVSDPRSPRKIRTIPGTEGRGAVLVSRDILVLNLSEESAAIYDISDPRSPLRCKVIDEGENALRAMCVSADYLVVKSEEKRIDVFDISDAANPMIHASRNLSKGTAIHGTAMEGDFIYFTGKGMSIYEIR